MNYEFKNNNITWLFRIERSGINPTILYLLTYKNNIYSFSRTIIDDKINWLSFDISLKYISPEAQRYANKIVKNIAFI